jgi:hypothetical protein
VLRLTSDHRGEIGMRWHLLDRDHSGADNHDGGSDAAFWTSPVGQAARAKLRGDRFFQIEVDDATLSEYAESAARAVSGRRARRTCDLLGQIEELGWHLEHVSWWRADTDGPVTAERPTGPHPDHVRGVYLFHSVPTDDVDGLDPAMASNAGVRTPTHRRNVS